MSTLTKGLTTYLVGGVVRDKLLGLQAHDRDWVVVGSTPEDMIARGFQSVGQHFPVFLHPETHEEYALARLEKKTGPGYKGFEFVFTPDITLDEDLIRRDLTVNAIAMTESGEIFDPCNGVKDIENRILRHVSVAFHEDPLRVLRVARFAARFHHLDFTVAKDTLALMTQMSLSGELDHLTPERVWQECEAALKTNSPHIYFHLLHQTGALSIILPQWQDTIDTIQKNLLEITEVSTNPVIRYAAASQHLPSAHISDIGKTLRVPKRYTQLALLTATHAQTICINKPLSAATCLQLLEKTDAFRHSERFEHLLTTCLKPPHTDIHTSPSTQFFLKARNIAAKVSAQPFIDKGYTGIDIKHAIHAERLKCLTTFIEQQDTPC